MAKVVIKIEDKPDGELDVQFTCDTPLPEEFKDWTLAQILSGQLHDLVNRLFEEPT